MDTDKLDARINATRLTERTLIALKELAKQDGGIQIQQMVRKILNKVAEEFYIERDKKSSN